MKQPMIVSGLLLAAIASPPTFGQATEDYSSLLDFCVKTRANTPEHCRCGQETADEIMTDDEQALALTMMAQRQPPSFASVAEHDAFMTKLSRVTSGCASHETPGRQ